MNVQVVSRSEILTVRIRRCNYVVNPMCQSICVHLRGRSGDGIAGVTVKTLNHPIAEYMNSLLQLKVVFHLPPALLWQKI